MKPSTKKLWVEALRSGNYKQGRGQLCSNDNTFCCLGVLADVAVEKDWVRETEDGTWAIKTTGPDGIPEYNAITLGLELLNKLDLDIGTEMTLVRMNDGRAPSVSNNFKAQKRYNFTEIADYIEKTVKCTTS